MRNTTGLTSNEVQRLAMPADSLVPYPMGVVTNAVKIDAPIARVWPWLVQMGGGRGGWYSYDWIDNGGHPSAKSIQPEYQQIAAGEIMPATPGATSAFRIAVVAPPCRLVLTVPDSRYDILVSWEFLLEPLNHGCTHLIVRGRISHHWPGRAPARPATSRSPYLIERIYTVLSHTPRPLMLIIAGCGHHLMEARMLRGIKRRAEARS